MHAFNAVLGHHFSDLTKRKHNKISVLKLIRTAFGTAFVEFHPNSSVLDGQDCLPWAKVRESIT